MKSHTIGSNNLLTQLQQKLLVVDPRRKNGLVIRYPHYAEFAGPGAIVGGKFDHEAIEIIPVGNLLLIEPANETELLKAYLIRRQWVKLTQQITDNPSATERALVILNQFEHWFDPQTVARLDDYTISLLVGILPQTIAKIRQEQILL